MWIKPPFERAKHRNAAGGGYSEVLRGRNKEQCRHSKEGNATMFLRGYKRRILKSENIRSFTYVQDDIGT